MDKEILKSLEPLFEKAEKEKLWFYTNYQGLWFTPSELREQHKKDCFVWGVDNWELKPICVLTHRLKQEAEDRLQQIKYYCDRHNKEFNTTDE